MVRLAGLLLTIAVGWGQPAEEARKSYNDMYASGQKVYSLEPNAFLTRMVSDRKPGRALDIGMGQGRNALWLAARGWDVTGIDVSDEGLAQARAEASRRGLRLKAERVGYSEFEYGEGQWDLIVLCYFLPRELPARIWKALKPGGLVVVEAFHADTAYVRLLPGGFGDNELMGLFSEYRTLHYEDVEAAAEWGGALSGANRVVRLMAQRPVGPRGGCRFEGKDVARGGTACWGTVQLRCEEKGWSRAGSCENSSKND